MSKKFMVIKNLKVFLFVSLLIVIENCASNAYLDDFLKSPLVKSMSRIRRECLDGGFNSERHKMYSSFAFPRAPIIGSYNPFMSEETRDDLPPERFKEKYPANTLHLNLPVPDTKEKLIGRIPGDMYWQIFSNFRIPLGGLEIHIASHSQNLKPETPYTLRPHYALFPDVPEEKTEKYSVSKDFLAGLFHPDIGTRNNDVVNKGEGWAFWPLRLHHVIPKEKEVPPHQLEKFSISVHNTLDAPQGGSPMILASPNDLWIRGLPASAATSSFWSLVIVPEEQKAIATFHLLTNDSDQKIIQSIYDNSHITKIGQIVPYLKEQNFGYISNNIHLKTLQEILAPTQDKINSLPEIERARNKVANCQGSPQKSYKINGKSFKLQNASGDNMRCFFNAIGLSAEAEIEKLKSKVNDQFVRIAIANEIVSAAENPEHLPTKVKEIINYDAYQRQRKQINNLQILYSEILAAQSTNGNEQNTEIALELLNAIESQDNLALKRLREGASTPQAFNAFLDHHIGKNQMMVSLQDMQRETQNNINISYTSIDAIAYINAIGIRIYQPNGVDSLRLAHQYIPEGAKEIAHVYHENLHFQALLPE